MEMNSVSQEAMRVVQQVERGELTASQANEKLLNLIVNAETIDDIQLAYIARAGLERLAANPQSGFGTKRNFQDNKLFI